MPWCIPLRRCVCESTDACNIVLIQLFTLTKKLSDNAVPALTLQNCWGGQHGYNTFALELAHSSDSKHGQCDLVFACHIQRTFETLDERFHCGLWQEGIKKYPSFSQVSLASKVEEVWPAKLHYPIHNQLKPSMTIQNLTTDRDKCGSCV